MGLYLKDSVSGTNGLNLNVSEISVSNRMNHRSFSLKTLFPRFSFFSSSKKEKENSSIIEIVAMLIVGCLIITFLMAYNIGKLILWLFNKQQ